MREYDSVSEILSTIKESVSKGKYFISLNKNRGDNIALIFRCNALITNGLVI